MPKGTKIKLTEKAGTREGHKATFTGDCTETVGKRENSKLNATELAKYPVGHHTYKKPFSVVQYDTDEDGHELATVELGSKTIMEIVNDRLKTKARNAKANDIQVEYGEKTPSKAHKANRRLEIVGQLSPEEFVQYRDLVLAGKETEAHAMLDKKTV